MTLTRIAGKIIAFVYFLLKFRSLKVAYLFSHYRVEIQAVQLLKIKGRSLLFTSTENEISIASLGLFKHGFSFLLKVLNSKDVRVKSSGNDGILLNVNNITLKVNDHSGIATIQEIFLENLYGFDLSFEHSVVLDIGMNTGYASLFFASMSQVDFIYSFEPFSGTFYVAQDNFNLNPKLSKKISRFCYGISNTSGSIIVPSFEAGSTIGSTNKAFIEGNIFESVAESVTEVDIRSIDIVLNDIRKKHPTTPVVLKIDCEGEEYNIIDQIQKSNQWENICLILMEWHINGPDTLLETLTRNKFTCINLPRIIDSGLKDTKTGMIYAIKN